MASAFGHAIAAIAIGNTVEKKLRSVKFILLSIACSILPDADAIGFKMGVAYESFWGHRGFTHSFVFAFITGVVVTFLFFKNNTSRSEQFLYTLFFFLSTASHSILDAMTSGGLGIAFFSPFDNHRYFFPWRPIKVSPISIISFFSERGWNVLKSELVWIGIPAGVNVLLLKLLRK